MQILLEIFAKGYIRHILENNGLNPCYLRENIVRNDWIKDKNECDIGRKTIKDKTHLIRMKL